MFRLSGSLKDSVIENGHTRAPKMEGEALAFCTFGKEQAPQYVPHFLLEHNEHSCVGNSGKRPSRTRLELD